MKPQEFLIGIRDFFAVIIPGATLLFLLPITPVAKQLPKLDGLALFGAGIAAYLVGSVASGIGSLLDLAVDPALESEGFRKHLGRKLKARESLARSLRDETLRMADYPAPDDHPESVKSFWWSYLRLNCPAAIAELDRIEATSKLFRSLVAVFLACAVLYFIWPRLGCRLHIGPGGLVLAAATSFLFYASGRFVFLNAVYRLGAAYALSIGRDQSKDGR